MNHVVHLRTPHYTHRQLHIFYRFVVSAQQRRGAKLAGGAILAEKMPADATAILDALRLHDVSCPCSWLMVHGLRFHNKVGCFPDVGC